MNQVLSVVIVEVGDEFLNEVVQVTEDDEGFQVGELRVIDEEIFNLDRIIELISLYHIFDLFVSVALRCGLDVLEVDVFIL